MDPSFLPTPPASGPNVNSPSDLSYSSGGSRSSTRNSSPGSIIATSSSPLPHPAPLLPSTSQQQATALLDFDLKADIEHSLHSLAESQSEMDRNPFQSISERRTKLATDRNSVNQSQQSQQPQAIQPQSLRHNMPPQLGLSTRNLASSNWRSSQAEDEATALMARTTGNGSGNSGGGGGCVSNDYPPFDPSIGIQHLRPLSFGSPHIEQFSLPSFSTSQQTQQLHSNMPSTSSPEMQINSSYAYCFDRGNGQYTRLIPADMLPPLEDIPALQQGCTGMIVLPMPRGLSPSGRSSNTETVVLRSSPTTPSSPSDNIQVSNNRLPEARYRIQELSRIDNIVASTPSTPTHHHHTSSSLSGSFSGLNLGAPTSLAATTALVPVSMAATTATVAVPSIGGPSHQHYHSHSHPHGNTHNHQGQNQPQRRPKIYCDKWVHEGVCAFTQQGCKYKHEMPFDKVTQHQLGLFHGFPAWWKKHQADLSRQRDAALPMAGEEPARLSSDNGPFMGRGGNGGDSGSGIGGGGLPSWRRSGGASAASTSDPAEQKSLGTGRGLGRGVGGGVRNPIVSYGSPFGPIAPPTRTSTTTPATTYNPEAPMGYQAQAQQMPKAGSNAIPTTNPFSSLEALGENSSGSGSGKDEPSCPVPSSSGARLT
ncbi:uncharacterized protein F4822DRAFT_205170 [Hypoxylon trugodes]|uniref:uncharacterized protein n=1 Tax=Hypoxylon trugodes TaxID=326681 RepID=UPI00218CCF93|nr:uncharacterized protein F4822DRAFT_205170 [Hypoxylon trugodes]KAI1389567.1 hypothetical protein F4822DRAFT_205170 [Hypoxylon trugodes]